MPIRQNNGRKMHFSKFIENSYQFCPSYDDFLSTEKFPTRILNDRKKDFRMNLEKESVRSYKMEPAPHTK